MLSLLVFIIVYFDQYDHEHLKLYTSYIINCNLNCILLWKRAFVNPAETLSSVRDQASKLAS